MTLTREKIFKEFSEFDNYDIGPKLQYLEELKVKLAKEDHKLDINIDALLEHYNTKYCK